MERQPGTLLDVQAAMRKYWGFDAFRPQQAEAIQAAVEGRDSVVVVPTGGGKSLCYQAPAATSASGVTLVVSPLIALMKDQVDALNARGIPAGLYNSSLDRRERRDVEQGLADHRFRLLYLAPERFPDAAFIERLTTAGVRSIAIDEAHCISHWGHDFRPDYRKLSALRRLFPGVGIHAFTATATPRVREDIAQQLGLLDPLFVVGDFDRPNLTYRTKWRSRLHEQLCDIIDRNRASAGIVYCIRRLDVEDTCGFLTQQGYRARPYHAGLPPDVRKANQDAFSRRAIDIIVATVAFGMGIDRPDIRFVVHTGMPKSLEAYQQETGRAGRDGLPAECTLFYTTADFMTWKSIVEKDGSEFLDAHLKQLSEMLDYCQSPVCRHQLLVRNFGQTYDRDNCGACDHCLGETATITDANTIAMKILSAVVRTGERYGAKYVAGVLVGADDEAIRARGHEALTVFGLMNEHDPRQIVRWIDQLASQDLLCAGNQYRTFSVTPQGWEVMRGRRQARLVAAPRTKRPRSTFRRPRESRATIAPASPTIAPASPMRRPAPERSTSDEDDPVISALYEALRDVRKKLAGQNNLPLYCVVSNKTLEHIARSKPTSEAALLAVPGMGTKKCAQYGRDLLDCVAQFVRQ